MNGKAIFSVALLTAWQGAQAEPVFMPQALSVLQAKQGEAGVGAQFGYQSYELLNSPGTTYKDRVWQFPLFARYGITDTVETKLMVPIVKAVDSAEDNTSFRNSDTGIGNVQMGAKWNFMKEAPVPLAAALDLDLPTANSRNNAAPLGERYSNQVQEGLNTHLQLIADSPKMNEFMQGHLALGYMNTATYTTTANTRFNPSDLMTFGASLDFDMKRWLNNVTVSAEMLGNTALNHSRTNGNLNGTDIGTVLEAGPAVRYQRGSLRSYAGFLVDAGPATYRAYNYRVNFGVSMLWGGHS